VLPKCNATQIKVRGRFHEKAARGNQIASSVQA
jgi:hypothetical protein